MCTTSTGYSSPEKADVKKHAAGRWAGIISALVPQLAEAVEAGPRKKVACPFHPGKSEQNLRVLPDFTETGAMACNTCGVMADGFATLVWAGRSFSEAVVDVDEWLNGRVRSLSPEAQARQQAEIEAKRLKAERQQAIDDVHHRRRLNEVWKESVSLDHPSAEPARLYLKKRGLYGIKHYPNELRFHASLSYKDEKGKYFGRWPAIVARLQTAQGMPGSLLRIYVAPDGEKPALPDRKKMMSAPSTTSLTGAAIRLSPASSILGIAEGVETALAVRLLTGINCWSAFSAQLLEGFIPPGGVEKVLVFADKDLNRRGEDAARTLVERLWAMGIVAGIRLPTEEIPIGAKGIDWLDVLVGRQPRFDSPVAKSA